MSEQEVLIATAVGTPAAAPVVTPAVPVKLTAIQVIEQELSGFMKSAEVAAKQAEQAVANNHAVQGAIQGAQRLLARLREEEAKAIAFAADEAKKL
jgi:hypothetical protein